MRQSVIHSQRIRVRHGVCPACVQPLASRSEEWTLDRAHEMRPQDIVEYGESERSTRSEESIFRECQRDLQTFRPAFEPGRQQLFAFEEIKDAVNDSQRAAELGVPSHQRRALLANFPDS